MKALIISLAGIGDTLFAGPLIHELRLNFPEAQLDALVMWPASRDILAANPHLNTVHQKNLITAGKFDSWRFLSGLRDAHYDVSINTIPQSRVQYRLISRIINSPVRISHTYPHFGWLTPWLVTKTIEPDYALHCVDNNLALLKLLDAAPKMERHAYELHPSQADFAWADDFLVQRSLRGLSILGVHVGSGETKNLATRRWPLHYFVQLVRRLNDAYPEVPVLLFGGPSEERDHAHLLDNVDRRRVLAPRTVHLNQAAALLSRCTAFLSVDTALMHVAAAMKVPRQLVIETPTWNKTVEPYNHPFTLVPNPAVAGRNLQFYKYDGQGIRGTAEQIIACMKSVTVDAVYARVREALKKV